MKLGIWGARADRRGLSTQTTEFARHLDPVRVMGFDLGAEVPSASPYPCDWRDYSGMNLEVRNRKEVTKDEAMKWLKGLDAVYSAETHYQEEFPVWAREAGVRTVLHVNPELCPLWTDPKVPWPDVVVAPTGWMLDRMGGRAIVLPTPVDRQRLVYRRREQALTFLHVVGHRAVSDRQGTQMVWQAFRYLTQPVRIVIRTQSSIGRNPYASRTARARIDVVHDNVADYWSLYDDADVLLAPRRFGGQSLPVQEALSCGLPVIALDRDPERAMLPAATLVKSVVRRRMKTHFGTIDVHDGFARDLAKMIDRLAKDDALVGRLSDDAHERAEALSWDRLLPAWIDVLAGRTKREDSDG